MWTWVRPWTVLQPRQEEEGGREGRRALGRGPVSHIHVLDATARQLSSACKFCDTESIRKQTLSAADILSCMI